jgi:hypothetical protein
MVYVAAELVTRSGWAGPIPEAGPEEVVAFWRPVSEALRLLGSTLLGPARKEPEAEREAPPV